MKTALNVVVKDGFEYRSYVEQGLVCPNPRERYLRTRSYADLKAEYDLLNCHKLDETDLMYLELAKVSVCQNNNFMIMVIIQVVVLLAMTYLLL